MSIWLVPLMIFVLAILLQALFAGYETGFVSFNIIRIRHWAEEENSGRARELLRHLANPAAMLTTLLIGTNLCVIGGTLALVRGFEAINVPHEWRDFMATCVATPVFLIFAEIIPKSIFRAHPNQLAMKLLPVIRLFHIILWPVSRPISFTIRLFLRAAGAQEHDINALMTSVEDVRVLVDESAAHGTIEKDEQRMIHSVIDLHSRQAKEIMVPRIDIQALPETATRDELLTLFRESGRTRIPIFKGTVDEVIGVANAHRVLLDNTLEGFSIQRYIQDVLHVPDTMKVDDLLAVMKQGKHHLVIVTDEYGGTDGLITIEDILEEIFGEIQDEHDAEESNIVPMSPKAFRVDARASLEEVCEVVGVTIEDDTVDTIGGWLMRIAGRIPAQGEVFHEQGMLITILEARPNLLSKIRIEKMEPAASSAQ